ncbi:MAG: GNAT family N-acetyltransferase [Pseudomonadota bacterium]
MTTTALKFQVGARTLASIQRRLARVSVDLTDAMAGRLPVLPELARDSDGYLVTSLAEPRRADLAAAVPGMIAHVRQRYTRYHTDLRIGFDDYLARMSGNARSGLKRKAKKIAEVSGGTLRVERFADPDEIEHFYDIARRISERTYQERLLGGGLPDDSGFVANMLAAAANDRVRGWLLTIAGEPAAYLYGEARGRILGYDHVGHDPAFNDLSPGAVLMLEAMRDLMNEGRFERFDFTEGEGQHKRQFATGGVPCCDMLLLRPSLANRLAAAALGGFERLATTAKQASDHPALKGLAKRVRRAG